MGDTFTPSGEQTVSGGGPAPGRISIDRFEMMQQWSERTEEEQVEAAAVLYEKAVRQWLPPSEPEETENVDSEELEVRSQQLRLQQKCQDIAALIMADEQGLMDSAEDDE